MILAVNEKISHLSTNVTSEKKLKHIKNKGEIFTKELKMLHNKVIVLPTDTASGEFSLVIVHFEQ